MKLKLPVASGVLILVLFLYLWKIAFFPNEVEKAKRNITTLAKIASFAVYQNPLQVLSKISEGKTYLSPELKVDISDFINSDNGQYSRNDLEPYFALYFKNIENIQILIQDFTEIGKKQFRFVVIAKGKFLADKFNDAYRVEVTFDENWKLSLIKVLAPPE